MDKKNHEKTVPCLFPYLGALSLNRAKNGRFWRPITSERLKISKIQGNMLHSEFDKL